MSGDWMRIRPFILLLALFPAIFFPLASHPAFASSVVHGSVYEWSTFDTLNNVEVTVNSVPQQVMVSKNGSYSFNLDKGSYSVIARSGNNATDALYARENVTITQDGGDYVIDLILFPSGDFSDLNFFDENITPIVTEEPLDIPTAQPQQQPSNMGPILLLAVILIILAAGAGAFLVLRKKKSPVIPEKPVEQAPPEPEEPILPPLPPTASGDVTLPDDLREVIRIIEKNGGRVTQLDLRKALPYSEAKVSLMITDLESRGIVKKIKKGRGNVIILNMPGDNSG
jgi:uncharacterized membrane protein